MQGSETLEFRPFYVKVEQVRPLLLFFSICADLLHSAIDQVLCVTVDSAQVLAGHHLVILWNASVSLLLVIQELFAQ